MDRKRERQSSPLHRLDMRLERYRDVPIITSGDSDRRRHIWLIVSGSKAVVGECGADVVESLRSDQLERFTAEQRRRLQRRNWSPATMGMGIVGLVLGLVPGVLTIIGPGAIIDPLLTAPGMLISAAGASAILISARRRARSIEHRSLPYAVADPRAHEPLITDIDISAADRLDVRAIDDFSAEPPTNRFHIVPDAATEQDLYSLPDDHLVVIDAKFHRAGLEPIGPGSAVRTAVVPADVFGDPQTWDETPRFLVEWFEARLDLADSETEIASIEPMIAKLVADGNTGTESHRAVVAEAQRMRAVIAELEESIDFYEREAPAAAVFDKRTRQEGL